MIYFSGYQGMQVVDPYYDSYGLYGQDKSREISVPFYHKQNYKIVKESDITLDKMKKFLMRVYLMRLKIL